jgi:hypothetical protein
LTYRSRGFRSWSVDSIDFGSVERQSIIAGSYGPAHIIVFDKKRDKKRK